MYCNTFSDTNQSYALAENMSMNLLGFEIREGMVCINSQTQYSGGVGFLRPRYCPTGYTREGNKFVYGNTVKEVLCCPEWYLLDDYTDPSSPICKNAVTTKYSSSSIGTNYTSTLNRLSDETPLHVSEEIMGENFPE